MLRSHAENVPVAMAWLLAETAEARGRQDLYTRQSPQALSRDMVRRVLRDLQHASQVSCLGRGPGAEWAKKA